MTAAVIDPDAPAEIEEGRTFPFATVGDFVALSGVSDRACRVYWLMRMHVNRKRERTLNDDSAWPTQKTLAAIIGVKKTDTIADAVKELVAISAVDVEIITTATGRRNRYRVHLAPPRGYDGHVALDDYYDARNDAAAKAAASSGPTEEPQVSEGDPKSGGTPPEGAADGGVPPENGAPIPPENGAPIPPENGAEPQEQQPQEHNQGGGLGGDVTRASGHPPSPPRPQRGKPETWKCARHLAAPDPDDAPCRDCKRERLRCEAREAELAAAETDAAAAAASRAEDCPVCIQDLSASREGRAVWIVVHPDTRVPVTPYQLCRHDRPFAEVWAAIEDVAPAPPTPLPAPRQVSSAELRAQLRSQWRPPRHPPEDLATGAPVAAAS